MIKPGSIVMYKGGHNRDCWLAYLGGAKRSHVNSRWYTRFTMQPCNRRDEQTSSGFCHELFEVREVLRRRRNFAEQPCPDEDSFVPNSRGGWLRLACNCVVPKKLYVAVCSEVDPNDISPCPNSEVEDDE